MFIACRGGNTWTFYQSTRGLLAALLLGLLREALLNEHSLLALDSLGVGVELKENVEVLRRGRERERMKGGKEGDGERFVQQQQ